MKEQNKLNHRIINPILKHNNECKVTLMSCEHRFSFSALNKSECKSSKHIRKDLTRHIFPSHTHPQKSFKKKNM